MRFRLVFRTAAVLLAIAAFALESSAAEMRKGNRHKAMHRPPVRLFYGGYYGQIGGHSYGPVPERNEFLKGSTYNYPGYYNNQFFWERVQTQRNFPVQY
jgi:hypothetical protein